MAGGLKDGIYDHLLDEALGALAEEAARREREVSIGDLDPARTPSFAAAHLRPLIERVLASVKGEDAAEKQGRRVADGSHCQQIDVLLFSNTLPDVDSRWHVARQ